MITVQVFNSREEAEIARSFLESEGITAVVRADDQAGLQPSLALIRGVQLLVESKDLERAKELLEGLDSES